MKDNFAICLPKLLVHEGGNDDDPRDPGGRTSRGIIQTEYDAWRTKHGLAKRDVWAAYDAEVAAIYQYEYWQRMNCDLLPAGVDYSVFDYGVNSGTYRSAWELQLVVGAPQDGDIGPVTAHDAMMIGAAAVIKALNAERLLFLRRLSTWPTFGGGWGLRVADVLHDSLLMATKYDDVCKGQVANG